MFDLRITKVAAMLLAFLLGPVTVFAAAPSPIPGGADQTGGMSGTFSSVLFNGVLRLRGMTLQDAKPEDKEHANAPGERPVVFRAIVSNGTHHENHGFFNATLSDADGITVTGRPLDDGWSLEPGSAARTTLGFSLPAGFVPVKLVLIAAAAPHPVAFRVTVGPTDLAATSPAPRQ